MRKYSFLFLSILLFACNNSNDSSAKNGDNAPSSSSIKKDDDKPSGATGCSAFFWFKKGVEMEYALSDGNGKIIGNTKTIINDVRQDGPALVADYTTTFGTSKPINATYRCEGDKLYMDMNSMFNTAGMQRAGVEIEVKQAYISFPWNMKEGDNLDDAKFEIRSKKDGKDFMSIISTVKNRKVENHETITTPAGSWDCMKLTETRTSTTEMMGKQVSSKDTRSVEWFAPKAGLVKFETYDDKDKLVSSSELISLKN